MARITYHCGNDGKTCVDVTSIRLSRHDGFSTALWDDIKSSYGLSDESDDVAIFDAIDDYFSGPTVCSLGIPSGVSFPNGGVRRVW